MHAGQIDILGFRGSGSKEVVGTVTLPTDDKLFEKISALLDSEARNTALGIISEVKSNLRSNGFRKERLNYASDFLGGPFMTELSFNDNFEEISLDMDTCVVQVGVRHAVRWIISRFNWMDEHGLKPSKGGSWAVSDGFLADLLSLRGLGVLNSEVAARKRRRINSIGRMQLSQSMKARWATAKAAGKTRL
jgi:hypothetical protein